MDKKITTKDLMALNELMTFENWVACKMLNYSEQVESNKLKTEFKTMAQAHATHHKNLLSYLKSNS
ncbi:MAG: hypothetical protein PHS54_06150 [Clostridia bacterium]|nr:hypothetical protein [Clostridia bacterium]